MDAAAALGRNPVSKHQFQPEYRNEQADAGRDCRTCLARPNFQARTQTGKYIPVIFFPVQLTTCRIDNLTRLIPTLAICLTIHPVLWFCSRTVFILLGQSSVFVIYHEETRVLYSSLYGPPYLHRCVHSHLCIVVVNHCRAHLRP